MISRRPLPFSSREVHLAVSGMVCAALVLVIGCGGGGGSTPAPANHQPVAVAGNAQSVFKRATVILDGTASVDADLDPLTYSWTQTGGSPVTLTGANSSKASFQAPNASDTLTFSLVASDGKTNSAPATTTVVVQNRLPQAVAGIDQTVDAGAQVTLDGSASTDPDQDSLAWTWSQVSGQQVTLTPAAQGKAIFTAPATAGVLVFSLQVGDGEASSAAATVSVTVRPAPLVASAGADQTLGKLKSAVLHGSCTPASQVPLTCLWQQTHGTAVTLQNPTTLNPTFTTPDASGDLVFSLIASDGTRSSAPSVVTIHVTNAVPVISSLVLTPAYPGKADTIAAVISASDSDGDPLTYTYRWFQNGAIVYGANAPVFPTGIQVEGDIIAVNVSVSDGEALVTGTASARVKYPFGTLTANAPASATYGSPLSFQVQAADLAGNPMDVELDYGPAGFEVTAAGLVTWTPSGPLLDRSVDVNWGVRVKSDPVNRLPGVITVNDPSRQYPILRNTIGAPRNGNAIEIQDYTGKGSREILIGSNQCIYLLGNNGPTFAQTWSYPFGTGGSGVSAVASGDIDGDGYRAIFFTEGRILVKLDGLTRREVARFGQDLSAMNGPQTAVTWSALNVADVDGDGVQEVICLGQDSGGVPWLFVLDARTLIPKWQLSQPGLGTALAVGNVDSDPGLEIVTSGGFVYDGLTHANKWAYGPGFGTSVEVGDVTGDGVGKIVGAVTWSAVRVYDAILKSPLWEIPVSDVDSIKVASLDGQAPAEIIVGDGQWGNVTVYRYNNQTKAPAMVTQINSQDHGVSGIAVGDVNGDGKAELVWGTGVTSSGADWVVVAGLSPGLTVQWKGPNPQLDGPYVGGKLATTAPGQERLMYVTPNTASGYDGMRVMALDPATGAVAQSAEVDSNWSRLSAMDVGSVYGNGIDQILLGTANLYSNYFTVLDFATGTKQWTSTYLGAPVAIAHGDLNGDGVADFVGITQDGHVYAWDALNQTQIWASTGLNGGVDVSVADLDGNGRPEIIALAGDRVVVYAWSAAGGTYLEQATYPISGLDLLVADIDGSGSPRIFVLGRAKTGGPLSVFQFDRMLNLLGSFPSPNATSLYLEGSSSARKNLLLAVNNNPIYQNQTYLDSQLMILDPFSGVLVWASPYLKGAVPPNSLSFCDPGGDGILKIAFGTAMGMYVTR